MVEAPGGSTWGHPQSEVILPSLIPLVFERFFAYFNFVVVPKQSLLPSVPEGYVAERFSAWN